MISRLPGLFVLGLALGPMIGTWGCAARQAAETPPVSCSVRGTFADVVDCVANQLGAVSAIDSSLASHPISAEFKVAPAGEVLDNLCEAYSCRWSLAGGVLRVVAGGGR